MKIRVIILSFCILLLIALSTLIHVLSYQESEILRLKSNNVALSYSLQKIEIEDSLKAVRCKTLTYTIAELREREKELKQELRKLDLKYNELRNITEIQQEALYSFRMKRDTIVVTDTVFDTDTIYCQSYSDKWIDYIAIGDSVSIATRDSLTVYKHCRTKKFLWWTCKKYSGEVTVISHNPYVTITGVMDIDIEK